MKSEFWAGRKVLVTGASGFVGSHLIEELNHRNAEVVGFVRAVPNQTVGNLESVREDIEVLRGDLQDPHSCRQAISKLKGHSGSVIFHLGAQAHVGQSWQRPYETIKTNTIGTLNLLQAVVDKDLDIHKFDTAGTSEQYGNRHPEKTYKRDGSGLLLDERSPINPKSIYATSKVAADFLTMNYHDAYGLPGVTTRMFNNYGPRQDPRYITPTIITQALERDFVELGNLSPKRDMCFVEDGVEGHLSVARSGNPGEVYTYGYGENISMKEWTEKILQLGAKNGYWSSEVSIKQSEDRYRPGDSDVEELRVGYEKIRDHTGWEPEYTWEDGVLKTINWYHNNKQAWRGRTDWE
ncbi:MAG: GDP-mannose 4,6-dehydratase [Candidatus Aenigmatarchaeota archaeon]